MLGGAMSPGVSYRLLRVNPADIVECFQLADEPLIKEAIRQLGSAVEKTTVQVQIGHRKSGDKLDCRELNTVANNHLKEARREIVHSLLVCGFAVYRLKPHPMNGRHPLLYPLAGSFEHQMVRDNLTDAFRTDNKNSKLPTEDEWSRVDEPNNTPDFLRNSAMLQLPDFVNKILPLWERNNPEAQLKYKSTPNDPVTIKNNAVRAKLNSIKEEKARILKHSQRALNADHLPYLMDVMSIETGVDIYVIVDDCNHIVDARAVPKNSPRLPQLNPFTGDCDFNNMRVLFSREYLKILDMTRVVIRTPAMLSASKVRSINAISDGIITSVNEEASHRFALSRKDPEKYQMNDADNNNMGAPEGDVINNPMYNADIRLMNILGEMQNVFRAIRESIHIHKANATALEHEGVKSVNFNDPKKQTPKSSGMANPLVLPPNYELTPIPRITFNDIIWKERDAAAEDVRKVFGIDNIASQATLKNSSVEQLMAVTEINNSKRAEDLIKVIERMYLYLTFDMYMLDILDDCVDSLNLYQKREMQKLKAELNKLDKEREVLARYQEYDTSEFDSDPEEDANDDTDAEEETNNKRRKKTFSQVQFAEYTNNPPTMQSTGSSSSSAPQEETAVDPEYTKRLMNMIDKVYQTQIDIVKREKREETNQGPTKVNANLLRRVFTPEQIRRFTMRFMSQIRISVVVPLSHPNSWEHLMATYEQGIIDGPTLQSQVLRSMNIFHKQQVMPHNDYRDKIRTEAIESGLIDLWREYNILKLQAKYAPEPTVAPGNAKKRKAPASSSSTPKRTKASSGEESSEEESTPASIAAEVMKKGKEKKVENDSLGRRPTRSTEHMGEERDAKRTIREQKPSTHRANEKKSKPAPNIVGQ